MRLSLPVFVAIALTLPCLVACDRTVTKYPFQLTRVDSNGHEHGSDARFADHPWACVRDDKTGLMWEVKTTAAGLHASGNTYTWYSRDENTNMGYEGRPQGGACTGSDCNTEAFIAAVNAERLCGYSDWRMPSTEEAGTLIDASIRFPGPTIAQDYFPNTESARSGYWTGTAFEKHRSGAWAWRLDHGADFVAMKDEPRYARAVRGNR